ARSGLATADIGYVECAAAGAKVADAAEIEALSAVFGPGAAGRTRIGTLKHNIGHLEAASGLSQLTKVILQLRHRRIAPGLMAGGPDLLPPEAHLAVRVVDRLEEWEGPGPRRALVNAVGAAGSYGHAVLREPPVPGPGWGERDPHAVLLSAGGPDQLEASAARLLAHPHDAGTDVGSLADVAV